MTLGNSDSGCEVIAEVGVNHNGEVETAKELIDKGAAAGADALKFQTFNPGAVVAEGAEKASYQDRAASENQYEMLSELSLSEDQHRELAEYCTQKNVEYLSTPYDADSVDLLESLGVSRYKIASADIVNKPLLETVAATGKPIILSTGMADLGEIERTVTWLEENGCENLSLLHCVSNYPADPEQVNMRFMDTLATAFGAPVGFSDHTKGVHHAVMAASRGAVLVEKHFTLNRGMVGPDHFASIEPDELQTLVDYLADVTAAMGTTKRKITQRERQNRQELRRSVHAARNLEAGEILTRADTEIVRPATGLSPWELETVLGEQVEDGIDAHAPITWDDIAR